MLLDASPDRSRLISTACAANTGVSCSATPGCAGMASAGDECDRRNDPDASSRRDASRDDVLLDFDSSSSSRVALSTAIESSRAALVDGAHGGPARDADARASPGRVPTPSAGVDAVTPSRPVATPRTPRVSTTSSSSLPLGADMSDDRVRDRKGQYRYIEDMCEFVCRLCVRHAWPPTMIRGGRRGARRRGYRASRDARRRRSDPTFCRSTQVCVEHTNVVCDDLQPIANR